MTAKTEFNIDIEQYLADKKNLIDSHIKKLFSGSNYIKPERLWDAVRYSILDGGKRIRGVLCLAAFESTIKTNSESSLYTEDCLTTICSIELIHSMSLIHDDLPSMDNDDLRRGKPSCHKAFDEATAILAGDAMLSLAFELIIENTNKISNIQKLKIINILSQAFSHGLVPGQILDLAYSDKKCGLKEIEDISKLKTAELIKASVLCGGIIGLNLSSVSAKDELHTKRILESLESYGTKIGIAFQIIDDILDITSDTKTLGKTSGKDEKQNKSTYPLIIGIDESKKMAEKLISEAISELKNLQIEDKLLSSLARFIINRIN